MESQDIQDRHQLRAEVFKALGHPSRLAIIEFLSEQRRCVCEFSQVLSADMSTISRHLTILKSAGLIRDTRQGTRVYYELCAPCVLGFLGCIDRMLTDQAQRKSQVFAQGQVGHDE